MRPWLCTLCTTFRVAPQAGCCQPAGLRGGQAGRRLQAPRLSRTLAMVLAGLLSAVLPMVCAAIGPRIVDDGPPSSVRPVPSAPTQISKETAWAQLLPADEREHFSMIPPPPLHDYLTMDVAASQSGSAAVNQALEGKSVRLPGFVVPLSLTADGLVSEFFLVPYVGACIHVPPPPPNQLVYIKLDKALALNMLYDAYWVSGTLHTHASGHQLGTAAYSMTALRVEPYKS